MGPHGSDLCQHWAGRVFKLWLMGHGCSRGAGADGACLVLAVRHTAAGPHLMVGKRLPSSGKILCCPIGLVTTFKSDVTVGYGWCHRCGALIPECFLCQLVFAVTWVTAGLLPYPVDWNINLLCLNFLVGMSWNCTESTSLWDWRVPAFVDVILLLVLQDRSVIRL